jgi:HSP20 family protein
MIIRNNPWQLLNDLNTIFENIGLRQKVPDDSSVESGQWIPMVDIKEETDKFILTVDIPGVDPKNVDISMENNVLTLKGMRPETTNEEKQSYHRIERIKGSFYRRFTLPDTADCEQVSAKSRYGVLDVMIGKKKILQARKITVESQE